MATILLEGKNLVMNESRLNSLVSPESGFKYNLEDFMKELLDRRMANLATIELINHEQIKPLEDENSQIEAELERLMKQTSSEHISSDKCSANLNIYLNPKIIDEDKFYAFLAKYPHIRKKEAPYKLGELEKLIDSGITPDPEIDGIDVNSTYQKISFRKKG